MKEHPLNTLRKYEQQSDSYGIGGWLLSMTESQSLSVGLRSLEIGGVYAPPQSARGLNGSLYILWADGLSSRAALTRPLVRDPEGLIRFMREAAFQDPFAPQIPEPQEKADVQVFGPAVAELLDRDPSDLFSYLERARETFQALETRNCQAGVGCFLKNRFIANSRGLNTHFTSTSMGFGATAESLYSVQASLRDRISPEETARQLRHLETMIPILKNKVSAPEEISTILFLPSVAQAFMEKYLLGNLSAEIIHDGRSAFRREEITEQKQRFHETFSLIHNPCRSMHTSSYPMDHQGLAARSVPFIRNGKLTSADVSLKGSRQTGWEPTPTANAYTVEITASSEEDLFECIRRTKRGFVVGSVLGLHTQDSGRGDYSVAVPHGIVVRDGEMTGTAKGILSGNFLDDLTREMVTLSSPLHEFKGVAFEGRVRF